MAQKPVKSQGQAFKVHAPADPIQAAQLNFEKSQIKSQGQAFKVHAPADPIQAAQLNFEGPTPKAPKARCPTPKAMSGVKRGLSLEYITFAWNVVGIGIVFYAAYHARSLALAGFGVDSLIEIGRLLDGVEWWSSEMWLIERVRSGCQV